MSTNTQPSRARRKYVLPSGAERKCVLPYGAEEKCVLPNGAARQIVKDMRQTNSAAICRLLVDLDKEEGISIVFFPLSAHSFTCSGMSS